MRRRTTEQLRAAARAEGFDTDRARAVETLAIESEASRAVAELSRAGIPFLVFKGPWLAELWRREGRVRHFSDVDLLVDALAIPDAIRTLTSGNRRVLTASSAGLSIQLESRNKTGVDLQSEVVHEPAIRRRLRLTTADIVARRRMADLSGWSAPVPSPEDNLIIVCVHAIRWDPLAIRSAVDVHVCATHDEIDWNELRRRCHDTGTGIAVATMLDRARSLLATPVSPKTVKGLARMIGWRGVVYCATRVSPRAQLRGTFGGGGRAARSVRSGFFDSLAAGAGIERP